jgi:hypothetical protein
VEASVKVMVMDRDKVIGHNLIRALLDRGAQVDVMGAIVAGMA